MAAVSAPLIAPATFGHADANLFDSATVWGARGRCVFLALLWAITAWTVVLSGDAAFADKPSAKVVPQLGHSIKPCASPAPHEL